MKTSYVPVSPSLLGKPDRPVEPRDDRASMRRDAEFVHGDGEQTAAFQEVDRWLKSDFQRSVRSYESLTPVRNLNWHRFTSSTIN